MCELHDEDEDKIPSGSVNPHGPAWYLRSPRFENLVNKSKQQFQRRYFCIYNVSMSCPSNKVTIQKTRATWPLSKHAKQNYVAFYTDRNDKNRNISYNNSSAPFERTLDSDSFFAIMWSYKNTGYFEFKASCYERDGSGEDADTIPGIQQG